MNGTTETVWWSDRWAWRGTLAAAPLGALGAIVYSLVVLRLPPVPALLAYGLGAALAAGVGCLLAGPLGGAAVALRRRREERRSDREDASVVLDLDPYPDEEVGRTPSHAAA